MNRSAARPPARPLARAALLATAAVAALTTLGACSSSASTGSSGGTAASSSYQGIGLVPPQPRPQFTLTDTAGKRYDFGAQTKGKPTLLFFGYTQCADVCPATMADIGVALRHVPAAVAKKVTVVFVSTDPKNDTGPVIAAWLKKFDGDTQGATFVGLRGTRAQVDAAQAAAHVFLAEDGGRTHSAQVLLYGPDGYARDSFAYSGRQEETAMQHDLPLVVRGADVGQNGAP